MKPSVYIDPIVEQVREEREKYAASFNYDVHAMAADLRRQQQAEQHTAVRRAPKRPEGRTEATRALR